jgi:hypothetical protein
MIYPFLIETYHSFPDNEVKVIRLFEYVQIPDPAAIALKRKKRGEPLEGTESTC